MNRWPLLWRGLMIFAILVIIPLGVGVALAHGTPTITVEPSIAAAGSRITVSGSGIDPGDTFTITLEGMADWFVLGEVTATGEGSAGSFALTYTLPADTAPGSYSVRVLTPGGDRSTADLTVTAPSDQADPGPAMIQEPSTAPHVINRSKPIGEVAGVLIMTNLAGGVGAWLARPRAS